MVFVPEVDQLSVCGPAVVGEPPTQPSQFQVKTEAKELPVKVTVEVLLTVELLVQALVAVKVLVGVGFTVTVKLKGGAEQTGGPKFATVRESVFTPGVCQLTVCGPGPEPPPQTQPPQFQ
jgi:hypothetical protein